VRLDKDRGGMPRVWMRIQKRLRARREGKKEEEQSSRCERGKGEKGKGFPDLAEGIENGKKRLPVPSSKGKGERRNLFYSFLPRGKKKREGEGPLAEKREGQKSNHFGKKKEEERTS